MSREEWLPIRYRDFYDIPRAIVVRYRGTLYFFDCPFDEDLDEYPPAFAVYRLPSSAARQVTHPSWERLAESGEFLTRVDASKLELDPTKRKSLRARVLEEILSE